MTKTKALVEVNDVREFVKDKIETWRSQIKKPEGYHIESNTLYRGKISDYEQVLELLDCVRQ